MQHAAVDWDDLRYVLAITRGNGLAGAARLLGVNSSSVYRRLDIIERRLEVRLFERLRTGYRLTAAGESFAEAAERVEREVHAAERSVQGVDVRLEGHLRVSTSDAVLLLVMPLLGAFRQKHPGISLDVNTTNTLVDLTRRDADVVVRATATVPEHLVGRSVGHLGFASFATRNYLDAAGRDRSLSDYDWIGYDGSLRRTAQALWMEKNVPETCVRLRFDQIGAVRTATLAGLGCAALPCFAGDGNPTLQRVRGTYHQSHIQVWVLTHPDLRRSARVRAFLQFCGTRLAAQSAALLGAPDP